MSTSILGTWNVWWQVEQYHSPLHLTLRETYCNGKSTRKLMVWKMSFLFGKAYPQGLTVSFRECIWWNFPMICNWLGLPPTQDASHKWRFRLGFPTKNGRILVVTATAWGVALVQALTHQDLDIDIESPFGSKPWVTFLMISVHSS